MYMGVYQLRTGLAIYCIQHYTVWILTIYKKGINMGNFRGNGKGGAAKKGGKSGGGFKSGRGGGFGNSRGGGGFSKGRGGYGGARNDRGGRGGYGNDSGERELFSAVCAECGNTCEVPFKPTGDKPVLCGDCFSKDKPGRGDRGRRDERPRRDDRRGDRGGRDAMNNRSEHYDMEFEKLHAKLDKVLQLLTPKHINRLASTNDAAEMDDIEDTDDVDNQ